MPVCSVSIMVVYSLIYFEKTEVIYHVQVLRHGIKL